MRAPLTVFASVSLWLPPVLAQALGDRGTERAACAYSCFPLHPTNRAPDATGTVTLGNVPSPFGVAVTADGRPRVRLLLDLAGLPDPAALGARAYVAWVTTPVLDPMIPLGRVMNGRTDLGEIAFNKFLVMVSAEPSPDVAERTGPLILRGRSPSVMLAGHDMLAEAPAADMAGEGGHQHHHGGPPMYPGLSMLPGVMALVPDVAELMVGRAGGRMADVPEAVPGQVVTLPDGGTLDLEAGFVRRTIGGQTLTMLAFNGQHPGPMVRVPAGATIFVNFTNHTPFATAVHWHGVRLENRFDGVPHVTQDPVPPGGRFQYRIHFRDAGIYWYHPHHREDIQQELGLYGNLLVDERDPEVLAPVHREQAMMLDDILMRDDGLMPFGDEAATFAMMGRFGNVFLVNGEPAWRMEASAGEVVRFFLTNAANTRTFNVSFTREGDTVALPLKVVASDVSRFVREAWSGHVTLGPAERYVVDVRFPEAGTWRLVNRVQAVDHRRGVHFLEESVLGTVSVRSQPAPDLGVPFDTLRAHADVASEVDALRSHFSRAADHTLTLTMETRDLPVALEQIMQFERIYFSPVEWAGTMPMMNWVSTGRRVTWVLEDETGARNDRIDWVFRVGDLVRIRVFNDPEAFHAMQHPLHIHGQRFLVVSRDGVPNPHLVWKDTVLLPVGTTTELLLEISNPGRWMVHCHIAEHLETGMSFVLEAEQ